MNNKLKGGWLAVLTTFVGLMALNGQAFFDAMLGLPRLVEAYTAMLPLGTNSLALSVLFAGGVYVWIERWAPSSWQPRNRDLIAECFALLACIALTVAQVTLTAHAPTRARDLLVAMALGAIGGWIAPWLAKALLAVLRKA